MKLTGIIRKIELNGNLPVPDAILETANFKANDFIEFFTNKDGSITIRKYNPLSEAAKEIRGCCELIAKIIGFSVAVIDRSGMIVAGSEYFEGSEGDSIYDNMGDHYEICSIAIVAKGERIGEIIITCHQDDQYTLEDETKAKALLEMSKELIEKSLK